MTLVNDNPFIHSILYNLKGNTLLGLKKIDQSKVQFEKAIKNNPKFLTPYLTLAKIYKSKKQVDNEIKIYKDLIENRSDLAVPHNSLGTIYENQDKYDLSESHYKKALEISPEYIPTMNNLAFFYAEQDKELDKALGLARSAYEKASNSLAIIDTLGWVYYKKQLYDSAVREFEICVEKSPDNSIFQYHYGLACNKTGEYGKATEALKKALALTPDFKGADNAKKVLSHL